MCWQRRPRSDCADAQSDQGLHCPITELLDTKECINREKSPDKTFHDAQDDTNLRSLYMFEGNFFSLDATLMMHMNASSILFSVQ